MPSKFHDITPIVVSEGNDDFFRVSSAVPTTATEIPPPHATMGTVVTVLFVVLGPPSSSQVSSPTLFPSPPKPTFSMASSAAETFFATIPQSKAARRTIHIAVVDVVVPPLTDGGNYGTTGSSNCVHHLSDVRGHFWPAVIVATELVRPTRFHNGDPLVLLTTRSICGGDTVYMVLALAPSLPCSMNYLARTHSPTTSFPGLQAVSSATDLQPATPRMTLMGLTSPVAVSTPPSLSDASSPAHPPSTTNNDFLPAFKCHGDCSFEERIFQQTYDNRVNGPRRHCYPADTATSQHSVRCRLLHPRRHSRTQSFPSTHGAATTGKSCSTGSLSVARAIDESHVATFQPPYDGHGEQQSETAQRAGLPASKPFLHRVLVVFNTLPFRNANTCSLP
ncbi:hypothetical protein ARMSODRAFT_1027569 [Armillaria solidipes]|uniref:Uncharacterized protein n=1 Tax=Armillaria solidipes TaxID=1076256 RepID=A0A2H3ARC4_9AGAR|nr:hypothetical protein ARMSODRAFT_1027569 [Armillaria solidipes]